VLSAVAALLIEPTVTLIAPNGLGLQLFICGLGAALLGGLTSLSGAFVGGLLVGVLTSEVSFLVPGSVPGAFTVVLFGVVVAVLLVRPQGLMGRVAARSEAA
jgi:branched-chain amino acid transport system permease protein